MLKLAQNLHQVCSAYADFLCYRASLNIASALGEEAKARVRAGTPTMSAADWQDFLY